MQSKCKKAWLDLKDAIARRQVWLSLGWMDIKLRYRGSVLGPFWITLSMAVIIAALGVVYSRLLHQPIREFIPFLTAGILFWNYFSALINESSDIYITAKDLITNVKNPYMIYVLRMIWVNTLVLVHNFAVLLLVMVLFHVPVNLNTLLVLPGYFLVTANLAAVAVIVSLLGTRFRDLPPIITSLVTVAFFVSPVTWKPSLLSGGRSLIVNLNPFSHYLDLVRSPLLGHALHLLSWVVTLGLTAFLVLAAFLLFSQHRHKIPFWV